MDASLEKVAEAALASLRAAASAHYAALAVGHKSSTVVGRIVGAVLSREKLDFAKLDQESEPKPEVARIYMAKSYDIVIAYLPPSSPFIEPLTKLRDEAVARIQG
jgi:hypothetical protein